MEKLLRIAEEIAKDQADGHLTIMRFTSGWKVMIGTPSLDIDGREEVRELFTHKTLEKALLWLIAENAYKEICQIDPITKATAAFWKRNR